jgi:capsular exopolysaccharide synthesis family protein
MSNEPYDSDTLKVENNETIIKELSLKFLHHWKWFLVSFLIFLGLAFLYLKIQIPQYKISGSILIKDEKKGLGQQDDMMQQLNLFSSNKLVDNEIEILKSSVLMKKVVTGLNLDIRYYVNGLFRDSELYNDGPVALQLIRPNALIYKEPLELDILNKGVVRMNGQYLQMDKPVETPYGLLIVRSMHNYSQIKELKIVVLPAAALVESLIKKLEITPSSKMSTVLMMSLVDPIPQRGCDILNKLVEYYNVAGVEDKNKVAASTLIFIEERLKLISKELGDAEKTVEDFKVGSNVTDISTESNLFLTSVQQNDTELNQVKIQQQVLNNIDQYVRSKGNTSGTVPATLGISDPILLSLINQLVEMEGKRTNLLKLVSPGNPMVQSIDDQITSLRKGINDNIASMQRNLAITRQQLENRNQKMEGMLKSIPGKERELVDVSRQQSIKNSLYIFLLQKREETALSYSSAVSDNRTVDIPIGSSSPVSPVPKIIYFIFALVGLVLPFSIISIIDLFNDKIKHHKDITDVTSTTILGETSHVNSAEPLVVTKMGRSIFAEQIRILRTNLAYVAPGTNLQSILLTSSIGGEGKSFLSLNIGASLAMMDKKTVILEFDLRKPKLKTALNISNTTGISDYLIGQVELDKIIIPIADQPNLSIITSGAIPPNPVELMVNGRLKDLFTALKEKFDYIIIDAPPIGIVTDAQILEEYSDATLYVVRRNFTPKSYLKFIDSLYMGKKLKHMNLIFNDVSDEGRYGYGYGYADKN